MMLFQQLLLGVNVLLILVFGIDYFVVDSPKVKPRTKARLGVLLGVLFFAFLVLLSAFAILAAALGRDMNYLALLAYVVIPFVIGKLASYRTLRFYSAVQAIALVLGAVTLAVI